MLPGDRKPSLLPMEVREKLQALAASSAKPFRIVGHSLSHDLSYLYGSETEARLNLIPALIEDVSGYPPPSEKKSGMSLKAMAKEAGYDIQDSRLRHCPVEDSIAALRVHQTAAGKPGDAGV